MPTRVHQAVLVLAFCLLLCVPGLKMLLAPEVPRLYGVKATPYPAFELSSRWLAAFEEYFVANLGFKRALVQLHNWVGYKVIGDLQSDAVLVGRDDWLYLKQDLGWEAFRSEEPLSPAQEKAWRRSLTGAQRWLSSQNIPFLFVLVPSKESVYPEFLPASATRARPATRLDEMVVLLRESQVDFIDLRGPLQAARKPQLVYDSIDSHWNGRGAEIGAKAMLHRAGELLGRDPADFARLGAVLRPRESWADIPLLLSLDGCVTEPSVALVPSAPRARRLAPPASVLEPTRKQMNRMVFEVDDPELPSAVILRDSFAETLMDAVVERFRRSVWVWTHDLDLREVAREKPDIVIVEMTERFFSGRPARLVTRPRRR